MSFWEKLRDISTGWYKREDPVLRVASLVWVACVVHLATLIIGLIVVGLS